MLVGQYACGRGNSAWLRVQGEFPDIKESNYIGPRGYTVDASAPPALLDSLVYKLSYYGYEPLWLCGCVLNPSAEFQAPE